MLCLINKWPVQSVRLEKGNDLPYSSTTYPLLWVVVPSCVTCMDKNRPACTLHLVLSFAKIETVSIRTSVWWIRFLFLLGIFCARGHPWTVYLFFSFFFVCVNSMYCVSCVHVLTAQVIFNALTFATLADSYGYRYGGSCRLQTCSTAFTCVRYKDEHTYDFSLHGWVSPLILQCSS